MQPRAEGKRYFDNAELSACGRDDVEQDLETLHRKRRRKLLEAVAAEHEEAAHRIGDLDMQQLPGDVGRKHAAAEARAAEAAGVATADIAAADHKLGLPCLQNLEHLRQTGFVMLKIGVHHRDIRRG